MLFVYGTLRDQDVLALVLGRAVAAETLTPAHAPGFKAVPFPGRVYPALVPAVGEAAPGLLVSGLDAADLGRLDAFEGDEYCRASLSVIAGGQAIAAEAYFPTQPVSSEGPPWSLLDWTRLHKGATLDAKMDNAVALRQRLTAARTETGSQSRG